MCLEPSTRGARLNGRGNGPGRAGRQLDRQASLDHAAISLEGGPGHVQGSVHFLPATLVVLLVDGVRVELQEGPVADGEEMRAHPPLHGGQRGQELRGGASEGAIVVLISVRARYSVNWFNRMVSPSSHRP